MIASMSAQPYFDAVTLAQAMAIFNAYSVVVWLVLGELFRISPQACRAMALGHALRLVTVLVGPLLLAAPVLGSLVFAWLSIGSTLALVIAWQRILQVRKGRRLPWAVAGLAAVVVLVSGIVGRGDVARLAAGLCLVILTADACVQLRRTLWRRLPLGVSLGLALPFVGWAVYGLVRSAAFYVPAWGEHFMQQGQPTALTIALSWLLHAGVSLSVLILLLWRLVSRVQTLVRLDGLTGALSRRAFESALLTALAWLRRGRPFAVVMIDIDFFKRINDQHGHAVGDAALKHCVRLWRSSLRESDQLARIGGEEFCVVLPGADLALAASIAERMRSRLAQTPLRWKGLSIPITASFGVALPATGDETGDATLARVDAELYRAKAAGRNCVCVAEEPAQAADGGGARPALPEGAA